MLGLYLGAAAALALPLHVVAHNTGYTASTGFKACDALLNSGLAEIVVFPEDVAYTESTSLYYAASNRKLQPNCIVQPRSTYDVSRVVKTLSRVSAAGNWDIAIRSGGHSDYDNNAVGRGVTIDLSYLRDIKLIENGKAQWTGTSQLTRSVAQIRPAARWGDVFSYLEKYGLSVTGGRSGHVGVGGLLLSGGASYHIQQFGISADNVINYEVVLADGSVVNANVWTNRDLFKALKGGGSNLGIVTRFDMRTFTIPSQVYGGMMFTSWADSDKVIDQFVDYTSGITYKGHPDHEFIIYRDDFGRRSVMVLAVSTDGNTDSDNLAPFKNMTLTRNTMSNQSMSRMAASIADAGGSDYLAFSLVLQSRKDVMEKARDIFERLTDEIAAENIPASVNFVFQPFPKLLAAINPGGNLFGLQNSLPANSILFESRITLGADDGEYKGVLSSKLGRANQELEAYSISLGGHSSYIYMNYASPEQDVIGSYGRDNVYFLKQTAAKYDPYGFFQHRVPGGWKVSRV
ncbi:hypothetical protein F66182_2261 [Fusarium sp. NRRL 66182]|nr:hypothetical protein F66182_2261 [Fusarium sp. NRRL 66182]